MYYEDLLMMMAWVVIALIVVALMRRLMNASANAASQAGTTSMPSQREVGKTRMAEDIRATKTSQVSDAIAILDDLGATSPGYRHYCELVGTSMASSNIIAPYSRRAVAYYDIKCYRLDAVPGGGQRETLVAHERSFDPFFFTDSSTDTPVYVDLESFGTNVILVNSTNHIEGPNSDFAKAFKTNASASAQQGTAAAGGAYAAVAHAAHDAGGVLGAALGALAWQPMPTQALVPATAGAGYADVAASTVGANAMFAGRGAGRQANGPRDHRGYGGARPPMGGPMRPPQHLGDFMGGYGGGPWVMGGGSGYRHRPTADPGDILLGMGLGALLNSMTSAQQQAATAYTTSADTFRGYRLVENVVPLGSPIYCIGEIYRSGTDVYMARSLAKDYPTSCFATKPEAEVLSAIELS